MVVEVGKDWVPVDVPRFAAYVIVQPQDRGVYVHLEDSTPNQGDAFFVAVNSIGKFPVPYSFFGLGTSTIYLRCDERTNVHYVMERRFGNLA